MELEIIHETKQLYAKIIKQINCVAATTTNTHGIIMLSEKTILPSVVQRDGYVSYIHKKFYSYFINYTFSVQQLFRLV